MTRTALFLIYVIGVSPLFACSAGTNGSGDTPGTVTGGASGGGTGGATSTGGSGASVGGTSGAGGSGALGGSGGTASAAAGDGGSLASGGTGGSATDHSASGVVVVLGSSTAAGTGPSDPNNAWVVRYTAYLAAEFPSFALTNLAQGGYTTYQIQASDYTPPDGRPGPDTNKNITAALALNPDAIIVNMPSNDAASNFSVQEQMDNYGRVADLAAEQGVLLWVATTQPRNFGDEAQRTAQTETRDAINDVFGAFAIDFWTTFAEADGTIKAEYDSGDGTHMNDAAHAILRDLVIAEEVPETVLGSRN